MLAALLVAALASAGCGARADHEQMGDRRYAEHAWIDALAEYRLAARQHHPSIELRAKLATAALRAGSLVEAAAAWRELGTGDAAAKSEAAEGLVRTARAAIEGRDVSGMRAAVLALRDLAPERLPELGAELIQGVAQGRGADPDLLLVAAGLARGASADSLVAIWADLESRGGRCAGAAGAFRGVMRRVSAPGLIRSARAGLANCEVDLGRTALAAGLLEQAETAFRAAVALGMPDSTVRLAWVLIGDTRWAGGDTVLATEAYHKALAGADEENPIAQRAREQLDRLTGTTPTPGNTPTP